MGLERRSKRRKGTMHVTEGSCICVEITLTIERAKDSYSSSSE